MKHLTIFAILIACLPLSAMAEGITLTVDGLRNARGNVLIMVFDQARAFNQLQLENAVGYAEIPARKGRVTHHFAALNAGPYAIFLFHDENGDEDLNHQGNSLLEGLGASGAPNPDDNPVFSQAAFPPGPVTVKIHYDQ